MLSSLNLPAGVDLNTGAFALVLFVAGAIVAVLLTLGVVALRRGVAFGTGHTLWRGALVLLGAALVWALLDRTAVRDDFAAERRVIETQIVELTARAIEPGSALACLDAVAGETVETACEKAIFVSPEAVAAAVTYVDARLTLLAAVVSLAKRDPNYSPPLERLRRPMEDDRFGIVGHVLATRGCNASGCPELKLLPKNGRVLANMKARAFEANVNGYAAGWNPAGPAVVAATPAAPAASSAPVTPSLPQTAVPGASTGLVSNGSSTSKFDFPSAASIPPVSIMTPEPEGTPAPAKPQAEPRAAPPAKKAASQASRRQSPAREKVRQPSPPLSVVPETAAPAASQNPGSR